MKKSLLILAALALFVGTAAAEKTVESPYSYEYRDIAHPINSQTRERIQTLILDAYEKAAEAETDGE